MAAARGGLSLPLGLLAALALAGAGCRQDDGRPFNPVRDMIEVSEDDERQLGLEFDREIRKHVTIVEDPVIAGFINDLGQEIVRGIEPQPFVYRFRVVLDPSLNAFAVPGGYIYFHSGTILAAGSIDELAGVMGHEVAHVKGRHYARMREKTQIPDLLVGLGGMAVAVATGEPGVFIAAQAANVAAKLSFTREYENEADRYGSIFMTRAGYAPAGITRFFERILDEQEKRPDEIPPYLFSHPDVEDRIASVERQAEDLRRTGSPDPRFSEELAEVQGRLAYLIETGRASAPPPQHSRRPERIEPLLAEAEKLAAAGETDRALFTLARAEALEPHDPRTPFRIGELLASEGRLLEAVDAYRRTLVLDSTRAQVFFRLGLAHRVLGNRHSAVQAFEQAARRSGEASALARRAEWHVETLIFPVVEETGFTAEDAPRFGEPTAELAAGTRRIAWQGRLGERYPDYAPHLSIDWRDPSGTAVTTTPVELHEGDRLGSTLTLDAPAAPGEWAAVLRYQADPLSRETVRVQMPR